MNITKGTIAQICLYWAIVILLGIAVGLNVPFILMVIWTVLVLLAG